MTCGSCEGVLKKRELQAEIQNRGRQSKGTPLYKSDGRCGSCRTSTTQIASSTPQTHICNTDIHQSGLPW